MRDEQELKTILDRVASHSRREFGDSLREVILYGSCARGEAQSESDVDVMVLVDSDPETLKRSDRSYAKLTSDIDLEYGVFVSPVLQDVETFEYWKDALPFFRNVDTEGLRISA
jgi:predicted nucleotidyltransferase